MTVSVLTPAGVGAIAVVRLTGADHAAFVSRHLARPPQAMRCVHSDLIDNGETIDDALVVLTDEGHLDLNVHGGVWLTERVVELAEAAGFRRVDALVDSTDPVERQVLADLPSALSRDVLRVLTAQPAAWHAMLDRGDPAELRRALEDRSLRRALDRPTVAIVGPPNVGKSTLANVLFGREHSITADAPGTTRDWVGETADLAGLVVTLIDTPGVRKTIDPIEAAAIERAGHATAGADCVLIVTDGSRTVLADERGVVDRLRADAVGRPVISVRTKSDLPSHDADAAGIRVSARTGAGVADLIGAIRAAIGVTDLTAQHARCWTDEQRYKVAARLESGGTSIG